MTTLQSPTETTGNVALEAAAAAACEVLPSVSPMTPGRPKRGTAAAVNKFAGAAIADFEGLTSGALAVLVEPDLVQALQASPLGPLDLAAATQPALDAAAELLGGRVGAARTVTLDLVANDLGGPFTVVPLKGTGGSAALLVSDSALTGTEPRPVAFKPATLGAPPAARGLEMLHGVIMDVTVELGRTRMSVRELLALSPGTVLELDRAAGSPADLLVNGRLIARGEVVVVDEDFGLRVTEIVDDTATS
jgi:flagellar motor switch protein FliN/FliY